MSDPPSDTPPDTPDLSIAILEQLSCPESPPEYTMDGLVLPTIPSQNDRYSRVTLVQPAPMKIPRGMHSMLLQPEPPYLAYGWVLRINPEGSPFYVNHTKRIVTDDPIYQSDVCRKIMLLTEHLYHLVAADSLALPDEYEIYVTVLDADHDEKMGKYYFIDHTTQTVFWLEEIDPERHDINLSPACSVNHMRYVLQEQYWIHCEYFPHRGVPKVLRMQLVDIFRQATADLLSSELSTFPYSAQECKEYLKIIRSSSSECNDFMTWTISRLWATMSRHRYNTFFGEDYAKTSRDQKRFDKPEPERPVALRIVSMLLFKLPVTLTAQLELLSVDDLTYGMHWRAFATDLLADWRESAYLALGFFVAGAAQVQVRSTSGANAVSEGLGTLSMVFALAAVASSGTLLQYYSGAEKFNAGAVAHHLSRIQSFRSGYEPIAQAYALPRALTFYSLFFLAARVLTAVGDLTELISHAPSIAVAAAICLVLWQMHRALRGAFYNPGESGVGGSASDTNSALEMGSSAKAKARAVFRRVGDTIRSVFHSS